MLLTISIPILVAALLVVFSGLVAARVSGRCDNCHTMHNSQGGSPMNLDGSETLNKVLLRNTCIGCHSSDSSSTTYTLGGCVVPVVNYTGAGEPTDYLAGGNFYWVAQSGGDAKGHNVLGISGPDQELDEAPGNVNHCGKSCHVSLATTSYNSPGCCGCHMNPAHHADDSATVIGELDNSTDGYYRFLSGHSYPLWGVCGIEDADWEAGHPKHTPGGTSHNEYLGWEEDLEWPAGFDNLGHTMTAFCCGCHGEFHREQDSGSWIRHPSDAVIPGDYEEYADAFGANGTGTGTYDPLVPVARPSLSGWSGPSAEVHLGTKGDPNSGDLVMCLSCHRPHGSRYDDVLRWYYGDMQAGAGPNTTGCFACHTTKDTGG
jgi:predicted CXXCH cytochrome family protein